MSKNGKGPKDYEIVEAFRDEQLSSGVIVRVLPFPAKLFDTLQSKALEKFPDPVPPKKIIKVAGGTEEIDDLTNPEYLEKKNDAEQQRRFWVGMKQSEKIIDFCIQVDIAPYEHIIKKLEEAYEEPAPIDLDERRGYFLTNYALRGRADYERITTVSLTLMAIGDGEIEARMDSFRSEISRAANINSETSGPNADVRMDLVRPEA